MSEAHIGEIRMFGGNFAPVGWAFCDGSLLSISANEALFQLIGTTYGGDGQTNFALPDLRDRAPIHMGQGNGLSPRTLGARSGVEAVASQADQRRDAGHHHYLGGDKQRHRHRPALLVQSLGQCRWLCGYAQQFDPAQRQKPQRLCHPGK